MGFRSEEKITINGCLLDDGRVGRVGGEQNFDFLSSDGARVVTEADNTVVRVGFEGVDDEFEEGMGLLLSINNHFSLRKLVRRREKWKEKGKGKTLKNQ